MDAPATGLIVTPRGYWGLGRVMSDDAADEAVTNFERARTTRVREREAMQSVLGAYFVNTTMLPLVGGGALGPARDRDGNVLRWSIWAPHKRALIDAPRVEPREDDEQTRLAFAKAHDLRYAMLAQGAVLTAKSVKEWLDG